MINVVENFLSPQYQDHLESTMLGREFPWFYLPFTSEPNYETCFPADGMQDGFQFVHTFVDQGALHSDRMSLVLPIAFALMAKEGIRTEHIERLKANVTFPIGESGFKPPHIDTSRPKTITAIYYVNDADGDTIFFDKYDALKLNGFQFSERMRFKPTKGTLVYFDADLFHSSEFPTSGQRCVLNFNFAQDIQ
ncbi:Oxoglutarate/iron-dependent dioxygenase [uncultured Caudovirales phage]|jgi:hypothetical protein|uniref:Oxoglutarate/iron-dependent dioxygenase n=1 Tax=uncultured Caudovirales phage TaxID=2100421 RepID=A0A6J5MFG2_9CAUD|nr:Oxoglutarate/iron-dependent dioxygenase [uncultured Caudovirales phage]